ncbi:MAG: DUF6653 family protein [Pseudomonadota bacterium]
MTNVFVAAERMMAMSEDDWLRHANPWSGWTRFLTVAPFLVLAIWSRIWIGWWALLAVVAALAWIWVNPRAFPPPQDYGSWMSRAVLGERIFLARDHYDIPAHHLAMANLTTAWAFVGVVPLIWGLVVLYPWATILGTALAILSKAWFCDRMVWLHAELTGTTPGTPMPDPVMPPRKAA